MSETDGLASPPAETPIAAVVPETPAVDLPGDPQPVDLDAKPEPEKAPEVEAKTTDELAGDDEFKEKKIPGSQKLKRRLQLIESDYEAATARAADLEKRLAQFNTPQQEQGKPGVDREPKESDFPGDYLAFERANVSWTTRQAVREEVARAQQQSQQESTQRQRREALIERQEAYDEQATVARDRIPDFDKIIASASDVKITNEELVDEIMASPKAALIHLHLAQNRETARELNALRGKELAREVGRLEMRLHLPQAKKATEATPPPSTPKGGAAPPFSLADSDINTYVEFRKKQIKAAR